MFFFFFLLGFYRTNARIYTKFDMKKRRREGNAIQVRPLNPMIKFIYIDDIIDCIP